MSTLASQQEFESLSILDDGRNAGGRHLGQYVVIQTQRDQRSLQLKKVLHFYTEYPNQIDKSAGIRNSKWLGMYDKNV
jgi:hypothetical protein